MIRHLWLRGEKTHKCFFLAQERTGSQFCISARARQNFRRYKNNIEFQIDDKFDHRSLRQERIYIATKPSRQSEMRRSGLGSCRKSECLNFNESHRSRPDTTCLSAAAFLRKLMPSLTLQCCCLRMNEEKMVQYFLKVTVWRCVIHYLKLSHEQIFFIF